jgi:hypothetical protein
MELSKQEIKEFCEFVEKKLKSNDYVSFSGWHSEPNRKMTPIAAAFYAKARTFTFNDHEYIIEHSSATSGRGGMDEGSPETYTVKILSKSNRLDVDDLLSKKEVVVRHFHGGEVKDFERPFPLNSVQSVLNVVEDLYDNTDYNIMVYRQKTGDVTVWVDEGRFTQR